MGLSGRRGIYYGGQKLVLYNSVMMSCYSQKDIGQFISGGINLMFYSIRGDKIYVEGIYHDLQDYENILR